jgi:hypothetical protein
MGRVGSAPRLGRLRQLAYRCDYETAPMTKCVMCNADALRALGGGVPPSPVVSEEAQSTRLPVNRHHSHGSEQKLPGKPIIVEIERRVRFPGRGQLLPAVGYLIQTGQGEVL